MKAIARRVLPSAAYLKLSQSKERCVELIVDCLVGVLRLFPVKLQACFRERMLVTAPLDYLGGKIELSVDSRLECAARLHACRKEPETVAWIESQLHADDVFYDVGANVGAYSLVADRFARGGCRVYAFEPSAINWHKLNVNLRLNHCDGRVVALPVALSDSTGVARLALSSLDAGAALHRLLTHSAQSSPSSNVLIQCTLAFRLDELIEKFGIAYPNLMKIDVDGDEWKVLDGARSVLSHPGLRSILIEIDEGSGTSKDVCRLLKYYGFEGSRGFKHGDANSRYANHIFSRAFVDRDYRNYTTCESS